ncbi:MAG: type I-E CRISPR-associated endoribonuclease Cas2 [Armatimonadetes bacterium]|nr:type I-E CRISPR-associated endoribonuclease Cas2 [Armatimonadota bacterium]
MVVLILERVPASLRGELSRWMIEPRVGVFVGTLSALVRDKLWERVADNPRVGGAMLLYRSNTEQGFAVRTAGDPDRSLVDFEGLMLVRIRPGAKGGRRKAVEQKDGF